MQKSRIQIWLYEQSDLRIEGQIIVSYLFTLLCNVCIFELNCNFPQGFDEYMNLVLDNAEELSVKKKTRRQLGRILLKGENITLMMVADGGSH